MKLFAPAKRILSCLLLCVFLFSLASCRDSSHQKINKDHVLLDISNKPLDANQYWKPLLGKYQKMEGTKEQWFSVRENATELLMSVGKKEYPLTQVTYKEYLCKQDNALGIRELHFIVDKKGYSALCKVGDSYYEHLSYADKTFDFTNFTVTVPIKKDLPGLVSAKEIDPTLSVNLRFAPKATAYLTEETAVALKLANQSLQATGYSLVLVDAYRPKTISILKENDAFFQRGDTVSVVLFNTKSGQLVDMGSSYLEMSERSLANYTGGTSLERWHRSFLKKAMTLAGFVSFEAMWWQYEYQKNSNLSIK